jgi:phosphopantetheine adenylyltransferase
MIKEIDRGSETVSLDECLESFTELRKKFRCVKYGNFKEQEILVNTFHKLQAKLIARVVREKQGIELKDLIQKILRHFSKKIETQLQLESLGKIDMEWLAAQIKKNPAILEEEERLNLEVEGRTSVNEIFLPDSRTPIYNFFDGKYDNPFNVKYIGRGIDRIKQSDYEFDYVDDNGLDKKLIVTIEEDVYMRLFSQYKFICGKEEKEVSYYDASIFDAIRFVQFVDKHTCDRATT